MSDLVVLVNSNNRKTGLREKISAHREGLLHRAFSILIFNSRGELLLQKRHSQKYHSGGLWSNTVCGHPGPGERFLAGAHRRLKEEMGFDCKLTKHRYFIYRSAFENGLTENEYDCVFTGRYDGEIAPHPGEIEACQWVSLEFLREDMLKQPQLYTYWSRKIILENLL